MKFARVILTMTSCRPFWDGCTHHSTELVLKPLLILFFQPGYHSRAIHYSQVLSSRVDHSTLTSRWYLLSSLVHPCSRFYLIPGPFRIVTYIVFSPLIVSEISCIHTSVCHYWWSSFFVLSVWLDLLYIKYSSLRSFNVVLQTLAGTRKFGRKVLCIPWETRSIQALYFRHQY